MAPFPTGKDAVVFFKTAVPLGPLVLIEASIAVRFVFVKDKFFVVSAHFCSFLSVCLSVHACFVLIRRKLPIKAVFVPPEK